MAARAARVRTVSAAGLLTLTRPDGQSVRLDAAIALSPMDGRVRIRAWKFNQAVFDLTLTPSGLWMEMPRDQGRRRQGLPAGLSAAQLARAMALFGGGMFGGPDMRVLDRGGVQLQLRKRLAQGQTLVARVDRATLTVRQYQVLDPHGSVRFTLVLHQYVQRQGIVWPMHLSAQSAGGRIEIALRDVTFNTPLPPRAFVPPRGAEKMP